MKTIDESELQNTRQAPGDGWYVIEACGDYPNTAWVEAKKAEVPFIQHITPEVLAAVVEAGVPPEGLPIDKDHLSMKLENDTAAMGWVRELALCGEQLCARIEWTPLGLPLVQGRCYKHFSTVYPPSVSQYLAGHYSPKRLSGLALTNQPNNRGGQPPITNCRRDEHDPLFCPHGGGEKHNKTNNTENMEYPAELLAALGLAEGATEEEVIAAAQEKASKAAAAEDAEAAARKAEEEAQQAKEDAVAAEADAMISTETAEAGVELTDEEEDEVRAEFSTNRAKGKRMLQLMIAAKGGSTLNRRRYPTKTPAAAPATGRRMTDLEKAAAACNRAKALCAEARSRGEKPNFWEVLRGVRIEDSLGN